MKTLMFVILLVVLVIPANAAVLFEDDFEGGSAEGWFENRSGVTRITSERAYSGSYSLSIIDDDASFNYRISGLPKNITVQIWFWDQIGLQYFKPSVTIFGHTYGGRECAIGVNGNNYYYRLENNGQLVPSSVTRSTGWHSAQFYSLPDTMELYIDGNFLVSTPFLPAVDWIQVGMGYFGGPNPSSPAYFDKVMVYEGPPQPVPEPSSILALYGGVVGLLAFRRRRK